MTYRDDPIWKELQACLSELDRYKSKSDRDDCRIANLQQKIDDLLRPKESKLVSAAWFCAYASSACASFMAMLSPGNRSAFFAIVMLASFCVMTVKGLMHGNRVIE